MTDLVRLPDAALVAVRCRPAVLDAAAAALTDWPFPRAANRFATVGATSILWTGPDDWLVIDENAQSAALVASLEKAFAGQAAAVVDISGNRARFRLSGGRAHGLMARACALDFDAPHFGIGHCAATIVARTQAFILQRDDAPTYEILVRRSYARYLSDWFDRASEAVSATSGAGPFRESATTRRHPA